MLPDALDGAFLLPIRPHVVYVQSNLLHAIQILPRAEMYPLSPRVLPREVVGEDVGVAPTSTAEGRKKKGRPSKRERTRKARDSVAALEGWGERGPGPGATRGRYLTARTALLDAVGGDEGWTRANARVAERMGALVS